MPAARPETIIMREAREAARKDGLRVTVRIAGVEVIVEPQPVGESAPPVQRSPQEDAKPRQPKAWRQ